VICASMPMAPIHFFQPLAVRRFAQPLNNALFIEVDRDRTARLRHISVYRRNIRRPGWRSIKTPRPRRAEALTISPRPGWPHALATVGFARHEFTYTPSWRCLKKPASLVTSRPRSGRLIPTLPFLWGLGQEAHWPLGLPLLYP
jgi:hypothetical protein